MNQQEIDRLFDKHGCEIGISKVIRIMGREEFTSAIQEAAAEIRRQELKALHDELGTLKWMGADAGWDMAIVAVRKHLRALAQSEQEGSKP